MIVYRPSTGNTRTLVGTDEEGNWFGESIGGNILLLSKKQEKFPYKVFNSSMDSSSTWFYNPVTDYDYINGSIYYRALYIGADEKENVAERIGDINASYSVLTDDVSAGSLADSVFDVKIYYEGIYTILNGDNSIVLETENDIDNRLPSVGWVDTLNINKTLSPGQYVKIWIKITTTKDIELLNFDNFDYSISINDLTIKVDRIVGRLNISKVYSTELDYESTNKDYLLKETLPFNFQFSNIIKVIDNLEKINVFYYDDDNILNNLIIKKGENVFENKYINVKFSDIGDKTKVSNELLYTTFSECLTVGSTGTTATSGFRPSTSVTPSTTALSGTPEDYLNYKFLVNIQNTKKDRNDFYIFYNEFVSDSDNYYVANYGHRQYNWNSGVFHLDLNYINDVLFEPIETGYDNRRELLSTNDTTKNDIKKYHFIKSVELIDDLFVGVGFDIEDCRITNNFTYINYIWEKDIIKGSVETQQTLVPITENNFLKMPTNYSNDLAYIIFGDINDVEFKDFDSVRETITLTDGKEILNMGSPHGNRIHHGYTNVSYDIPKNYDDFSTTWSFGVDINSIATPSSTGSTGSPTTGSSDTSGSPETPSTTAFTESVFFNKSTYYHNYPILQDTLNNVSSFSDKIGVFNRSQWIWSSGYKDIFKLHCKSNPFEYALIVKYDYYTEKWMIVTKNSQGDDVETIIQGGDIDENDNLLNENVISFMHDNVITLNTNRVLVYGCGKKYYINFNLYVNGKLLLDGYTYTENTTDSYIVTHNNENAFSGWLSYWEVRNSLLEEGEKYSEIMYDIFSNLSWAELETLTENVNSDNGFEEFNFKQSIMLNNLYRDGVEEDFIFPIVLQGNGYNIDSSYNKNIRRSVFDFSLINTLNPSFAFTYEGVSDKLEWFAQPYDFNKDRMVVWVKLNKWRGQRLTMYISDVRLINDENINNPYKENYYGVWHMNGLIEQNVARYDDHKVFDIGEALVSVRNENGQFLIQLDRQYPFGIQRLYKSNYFDVNYDDREVSRDREETVAEYISTNVKYLSPNYMEIRKIGGIYPLKTESQNQSKNGAQ